jgi:hypothetical protein
MIKMQAARQKILELCSEDDYGVWEVFGSLTPLFKKENQEKNAEALFTQLLQDLINERLIVSKVKNRATNQLEAVAFNANTLMIQLKNLASPDPESFYWFGFPT